METGAVVFGVGTTAGSSSPDLKVVAQRWLVPFALFAGFLILFLVTPTRLYTFDSISYAYQIRNYINTGKAGFDIYTRSDDWVQAGSTVASVCFAGNSSRLAVLIGETTDFAVGPSEGVHHFASFYIRRSLCRYV